MTRNVVTKQRSGRKTIQEIKPGLDRRSAGDGTGRMLGGLKVTRQEACGRPFAEIVFVGLPARQIY